MPFAVAAGVGAVGSIIGGAMSGSAAQSAADTQAAAAEQAAQIQQQEFQQTQQNLAPYMAAGTNALSALQSYLGLPAATAAPPPAPANNNLPGPGGFVAAPTSGTWSPGQIASELINGGTTTNVTTLPGGIPGFSLGNGLYATNQPDPRTGAQTVAVVDGGGNVIASMSPQGGIGPNPQQQIQSFLTDYIQGGIPGSAPAQPAAAVPAAAPSAPAYATTAPQNLLTAASQSFLNSPAAKAIGTTYQASPGYGWQLQQGMNAITNSAAARGGITGGNTLKALQTYGQGLANQDYQQWLANYLGSLTGYQSMYATQANNYENQLAALAGSGQNAAANLGGLGQQAASNIGNNLTSGAAASAAGTVGAANALSSGISGAGNSVMNSLLLSQLINNNGWTSPQLTNILGGSTSDFGFNIPSF